MALIERENVWELVGDFAETVRPGSKLEGVIKRYANAIDNAPTIDAIPVEWLREKIKEHTDEEGWQDYLANSFGLCVEEWQKEQEAR